MAELQSMWGWMIAIYLFLGGLSAGVFCTVSVLRLIGKGKYKSTLRFGAWLATIALAVGLLFLLLDVDKPFQALMLWASFSNLGSWMAIGAWLLFAGFIVFLLAAIFSTERITSALGKLWKPFDSGRDNITKVLAIIGIPLSLCVAIYTGVLLGAAPSIPLWNSWLLPVLFTVSALDTGVAAVLIYLVMRETDEAVHRIHRLLERAVVVLVVLELIVVAAYMFSMLGGTVSESLAAGLITSGPLAIAFWALVIVVGLAVPLIAALVQIFTGRGKNTVEVDGSGVVSSGAMMKWVPIVAAICALIGGLALRYIILSAGIHGVMISPDVVQAMQGIYYFVS